MQRVHPETLGPEVRHIYMVSNRGPSPLENLWVNLSLPVHTQEGDYLIYLLDRIRFPVADGGPPISVSVTPEVACPSLPPLSSSHSTNL
ncbi:unnamed protein product [Protopolystoma xenopodis]|uniref:Integrin alpha third immunoglobulin-like domain-containing protein n=1 Tax=Protopolystoma xenopodis TaxID=117903 RepID=A0A3S5AEB9_9PLAT|nr:unnamed protein product [Protopolystoma xenopodis]